jgi:hypothetical protein
MKSRRLLWVAASGLALAGPALAGAPTGDPMAGRALFIGARAFEKGGSPCGACHAIGGESAPFAASLGPELSASFDGLDAEAVDGMLQDPPFPTMVPIYAGHPLSPAERADLTAFLLQASGKPAPGGRQVATYAAIIAVVGLALVGLVARRRKGSMREALLARTPLAPPARPRRPRLTTDSTQRPGDAQPATARRVHGGSR